MHNILTAQNIKVTINGKEIVHGLDFGIPEGRITAIIGPNGCGKSTTLKAICRLIPCTGSVEYAQQDIKNFSRRDFAKIIAILTQSPQAPADLTVRDLVEMGRFPHRSLFGGGGKDDKEHVDWALKEANLTQFQERLLVTLSGGERQRAWIAMALAQRPKVLFLDEPTTYLDISHQLEVMQLLARLNKELGITIVMVIHELNHAIQYADHVIVIKQGELVTSGDPREIITPGLLDKVFNVQADEFTCSNGMRALVPIDLHK